MHRPEVHDVLRRFRRIADEFETKPILVGETWVDELDRLAAFYGDGDELHLAMNFPATLAAFGPELRAAVEAWQWALPRDAWPIWAASNHDVVRFPTRWCGDDDAKVRLALVLLLTLRGTPLLYYGDEFGMGQVEIPREELRDPVGKRGWPEERGRDGSRTPMQWTGTAAAAGSRTPASAPGCGSETTSAATSPRSAATTSRSSTSAAT